MINYEKMYLTPQGASLWSKNASKVQYKVDETMFFSLTETQARLAEYNCFVDVCCGDGQHIPAQFDFRKSISRHINYIGLDISPYLLAKNKKNIEPLVSSYNNDIFFLDEASVKQLSKDYQERANTVYLCLGVTLGCFDQKILQQFLKLDRYIISLELYNGQTTRPISETHKNLSLQNHNNLIAEPTQDIWNEELKRFERYGINKDKELVLISYYHKYNKTEFDKYATTQIGDTLIIYKL